MTIPATAKLLVMRAHHGVVSSTRVRFDCIELTLLCIDCWSVVILNAKVWIWSCAFTNCGLALAASSATSDSANL